VTALLRISPEEATAALPDAALRFATLFQRQDLEVEIYAPLGSDPQQPHDRDELYIIISGTGRFRRGDQVVGFGPGDLLFVPAGIVHRFEEFSIGFATWVIFFGERVGQGEEGNG